MIIKEECQTCGKVAIEVSRLKLDKTEIIKLACGHIKVNKLLSTDLTDTIVFEDGLSPRPYQMEAVKFAERSGFRCIIADEQGLGKTIEVLTLLRIHKLFPALIIVPSSVTIQWLREVERIIPDIKTQVIRSGKELAVPGFQIYITTYDLLKKSVVFDLILPDIKIVIADECQRVKNHLSERAKAVQKAAKGKPHFIAMSGTPIKNHAGEYFTILNLVAPTRFLNYQRFLDRYCDYYNNGYGYKIGGLKNPERFHEETNDLIIRRTKNDVLQDLPALERKFYHVELDPKLNSAYAKALDELDDILYDDGISEFDRNSNTLAVMSRLRHITGISKVVECTEFIEEFLESSDRKIVVFVHHKDVADMLKSKISAETGLEALMLHSGLGSIDRTELINRFKDSESRVMIASTLAAGEGINLQFCSDAVILERQWNPANEEQAEARFHRFGQKNNVSITYMIASGTIDEYFTELVEVKRGIVASAVDKKEIRWDEQSLMKELVHVLVTKGRSRWKLAR